MKKILIIALLFTVACAGSSYKGNDTDRQLAQKLIGTWEGSIFLDDEIPADIQFFEGTDGTTGNFVEIAYLHEIDGDFDIRYFAYVSGEFTVKDGVLSLDFNPETTYTEAYDDDYLAEYAHALWTYYIEEGKELLWDDETDLAYSVLDMLNDEWSATCEARNEAGNSFSNLTVSDSKMSFVAGNGTWEFKRADHDWFTGFPFGE